MFVYLVVYSFVVLVWHHQVVMGSAVTYKGYVRVM